MALSDDVMGKTQNILGAAIKGALYVGLAAAVISLGFAIVPGIWMGIAHLAAIEGTTFGIGHILAATGLGAIAGGVFFGALSIIPGVRSIGNFLKSSSSSQSNQLASLQQSRQVSVSPDITPTVVEGRQLSGTELAALGDAKSTSSVGHSM